MDPSKLTLKSQTALEAASQDASRRNQQAVEPEHVLLALLSDPEGVIFPLLHNAGVSPRVLRDQVEEAVDRLPKVYSQGGEVRPSARRDVNCAVAVLSADAAHRAVPWPRSRSYAAKTAAASADRQVGATGTPHARPRTTSRAPWPRSPD